MKFIQKNFTYLIIIILAVILALTTCKNGCNRPPDIAKSDTVKTVDTFYLRGPLVEVPVYKPGKTVYIPAKPGDISPADTSSVAALVKQYGELSEAHYAKNIYQDSVKLKDDRFKGKDLGTLYINDTISQNELTSRSISYRLTFPVINNTTTITNTIEEKKKVQLYAGIGLTGNKQNLISGINGLLTVKSKKDVLYGASAGYQQAFGKVYPQFGASVQIKIGKKNK